MANMRYQPQGVARQSLGNPIASKLTALFAFNGNFRSALPRSGNPVVTAGPTFALGPAGYYAIGNGAGKVATDILPAALGMQGAAPRTLIVEFDMPDSASMTNVFSFGDGSTATRSMNALQINNQFRTVRFDTYGNDTNYLVHSVSGTAARVFLAITYDGSVTLTFRSWAYIYSTRAVVFSSQTSTLAGPMATGNTAPLNLMGGGAYSFAAMTTGLYHLSMYGGSVLSDDEILSVYQNRWQLFYAPEADDFVPAAAPASVTGTLAATLAAPTMSATGLSVNAGGFAATLAAPTMAASGIAATPPSGAFAATMAAPSMSAAGLATNYASFAATMAAPTMSATGTAAPHATGTLTFTMPAPSMSAFGFLGATAPAAPVRPYRWRILRRHFVVT